MTYNEAIEYLFNVAPMFQNIGAGAYKEGLSNTNLLDEHFGHPHQFYRTIHIAGTNGKGSCSHTLAAILQSAGYKVGLYTSPHLVDFRERIRVNGQMISEQRVIDFVQQERSFFEPLYPSFFELATALAFQYFKEQKVDVAVIEVGLGGRLDCTNIITPELSVITNISFDHTQFLGNTLPLIASEKAGIIKPNIPVVIGETGENKKVRDVFLQKFLKESKYSEMVFADESNEVLSSTFLPKGNTTYKTQHFGTFEAELGGVCQAKNTSTILNAILLLRKRNFNIKLSHIHEGFRNVGELTGLMGRWQRVSHSPLTVCDTGHNPGGFQYIAQQIIEQTADTKHLIIGMVSDKDVKGSLSMLPKNAKYYFTQASVKRAMDASELKKIGDQLGYESSVYNTVADAYEAALADASEHDFIYIGGSTFVVADFLLSLQNKKMLS